MADFRGEQRGSTLLVALIMLVLLTLIAVSAINSTSTSIQVVGNAQFQQEATAAAQRALETALSNTNFMSARPAQQTFDINNDGVVDYTVTFTPMPYCSSYKKVSVTDLNLPDVCVGSEAVTCYWTTWDITAVAADAHSGASMTMHQGIRTISGLNAALASCGNPLTP